MDEQDPNYANLPAWKKLSICSANICDVGHMMSPALSRALTSSALPMTALTLLRGWPSDYSEVVPPIMYSGLFFNLLGFADGMLETFDEKIEQTSRDSALYKMLISVRQWYRATTSGFSAFAFSEQFLIAIILDIWDKSDRKFDVNFAVFMAISYFPFMLGGWTFILNGLGMKLPAQLQSFQQVSQYAVLSLFRFLINAGTLHSSFQFIENIFGVKTSPREQFLRYSFATIPPLMAQGAMLLNYLPEACVPNLIRQLPQRRRQLLKNSPVILFNILSAVTYALFNFMTALKFRSQFGEAGLIVYGAFWLAMIYLPLIFAPFFKDLPEKVAIVEEIPLLESPDDDSSPPPSSSPSAEAPLTPAFPLLSGPSGGRGYGSTDMRNNGGLSSMSVNADDGGIVVVTSSSASRRVAWDLTSVGATRNDDKTVPASSLESRGNDGGSKRYDAALDNRLPVAHYTRLGLMPPPSAERFSLSATPLPPAERIQDGLQYQDGGETDLPPSLSLSRSSSPGRGSNV